MAAIEKPIQRVKRRPVKNKWHQCPMFSHIFDHRDMHTLEENLTAVELSPRKDWKGTKQFVKIPNPSNIMTMRG